MDPVRSHSNSNLVSVVICTHSPENYANLIEAVNSLLSQSHKETEIIVIVDANKQLGARIASNYPCHNNVKVIVTELNLGVSQARNMGIRAAQGEIIAFLDDDAVANKEWIAKLFDTYQRYDALAVGGKILPVWLSGKPDYLPEELYWLVGVTHKGFAEEKVAEVRDTFGPNMSFRRQVFDQVGYFNESLGFAIKGTSYIQAEEAEFGLRMKSNLGIGVIYNPEAVVYHKVPSSKLKLSFLLKRSFFQGYSKALLRKLISSPESLRTEKSYLKDLVFKYIPGRIKRLFSGTKPLTEVKQLSVLFLSVVAVGLGFIYGHIMGGELDKGLPAS